MGFGGGGGFGSGGFGSSAHGVSATVRYLIRYTYDLYVRMMVKTASYVSTRVDSASYVVKRFKSSVKL